MKKNCFLIAFLFFGLAAQATNYYVDAVNGNNGNSGTNPGLAFKTIPTAAALTNAGDTVFIMAGSYAPFTISRPGNATAQIVYTNFPGNTPQIVSTSSTYITVTVAPGANYVTVNGLVVIGYGVNLSLDADTAAAQAAIVCAPGATSTTNVTFIPKYNGSGINIGGSAVITHHVVISNNIVHDCAAVGIGIGYSDYITIDGNTVYNNSWYTPYGTSGISFGNSLNYDNNITTYRNVVKNNVCYGNRLYVLWRGSCTISDGNGIIIDIPQTGYNGKQLVVNNVCYNNGGSGIHTINNNHVDFINNTAYLNSASPTNGGSAIYAYGSDDVKFYNNILVSRPGKTVNRCPNSTNVIYDYNVYYGGSVLNYVGTHSLIQDPVFVNASLDPALADFHLQNGSFAVNNGDNANTTATDKDGLARPVASVVDMGIFESPYSVRLNAYSVAPVSAQLAPGAGSGAGSAYFYGPFYSRPSVAYQQSRYAYIYPQNLLANYSIPGNCLLTSLKFKRSGGNTQVPPANSTVRVCLRNESTDNFGAADFDWTTILPGAANAAVLVYGGDATPLFGAADGLQTVNFQVPFRYTGGHLGVYIEYLQNGSIAGGLDITWAYDNNGQASGVKYVSATGTATTVAPALAVLTTTNVRKPVLTMGYTTGNILPVSLIQFNAVKREGSVYVAWLVGSETNNAGFEVQCSKDGNAFEAIGFVPSKSVNGNSSDAAYYDFTDRNPISGTSFYRLLQKDRDGKMIYSKIVSLKNVVSSLSLVSIYPNPVRDKVAALVSIFQQNAVATITVRDAGGRTVSRFTKALVVGYNNIELAMTGKSSGTYLLMIQLPSGEAITEKFIKN